MANMNNKNGQGGNTQDRDYDRRQQGGQEQSGQSMEELNSNKTEIEGWKPGQVGEVQDQDQDGRLKENRMAGKTLGTTQHSKEAPNAMKDGERINQQEEKEEMNQH